MPKTSDMVPVLPFALTAALGTLAGITLAKWWLRVLSRDHRREPLAGETTAESGETAREWLIYCPTCRVHLVAATARHCREPNCGYPG